MKRDAPSEEQSEAAKKPRGGGPGDGHEFGHLKGQLLVEAIFSKYGSGITCIPWMNRETGERNIKRDPINRPIMESLAEAYCDRILQSGLNVDCSGRAWMVCASSNAQLPAYAITYNHRSEAMYRAISREPQNPYVQKALKTGLENVRMLAAHTPLEIKQLLCSMHNNYHDGAGDTWISLLDKSEELMTDWDVKINGPQGTGLTTRNSQYEQFLEQFVFQEKQAQGWGSSLNYFKTTNVLNNYLQKFFIKEEIRQWCNEHMNIADCKMGNRDIIMMGHQLTVLIVNGMTKYYDKEFIGAAIVEAIKFCVPARHAGSGERLIPHLFTKPGAETLAIMQYLTTPMSSSAAFKKLEAEKEAFDEKEKEKDQTSQDAPPQPTEAQASLPSLKGGRGRGAGKSKAKGRGKSSKAGRGNDRAEASGTNNELDLNDIANWSSLAFPLAGDAASSELSRHKTALDDFMNIFLGLVAKHRHIQKTNQNGNEKNFPVVVKALFRHASSIFFEFVWSGSAAINGKFARAYTAFRSELITFLNTAMESSVASGGIQMSAKLADFMDMDTPSIGLGAGSGNLQDETEETKAVERVKLAVTTLSKPGSGFVEFVTDVLPLPLEFHAKFVAAKAALAVNQNITSSSSLQEVLLQVFEALKDAVPQLWINFAADVSDLWGLRCGFVAGSEKLFNDRKDLLERLITIRSLYTCTLLRDLALLKKTGFESTVNLLASSLQVDLSNVLKAMAAAVTAAPAENGGTNVETLDSEMTSKPHPVIALVPGFDSLQSAETWARNWTSLLNSKTQDGAYGFLKMFVGPGAKQSFLNQHTNQGAKRTRQDKSGDAPQSEEDDDSADEPAGTDDIVKSMKLSDLAVSGMQLIEKSADYKTLFGEAPGQLSAFDIRKLEMYLELFLWDITEISKAASDGRIVWNFGDPKEEDQAFSSGDRGKVAKVNKKMQSERRMITRIGEMTNELTFNDFKLHFLGRVTTTRTTNSIFLCKLFDLEFYVAAVPAPSPTNPLVVPAWLAGSTPKIEQATVWEAKDVRQCVLDKDMKVALERAPDNDNDSGDRRAKVRFDLTLTMLSASNGVKQAIAEKKEMVPITKYVPKKKTEKTSSGVAAAEDSAGPVLGYAAALHERAVAMQSKGLKTTLPTLSKEERKVEKEKKRLLASASHLMR